MHINNSIKLLRIKKNLTQQDLADAVGSTRQTILAIEKAKYSPSLSLAFEIAKVLGVGIEEVFFTLKEKE